MGKERFRNVFGDRPIKWAIAKKKTHQNINPQFINMDLQKVRSFRCMIKKYL